MKTATTGVILLVTLVPAAAQVATPRKIHVALDGSGDYRSIQAAIDSLSVAGREPVLLQIENGIYYEKLRIRRDRITLLGESRDGVRIRYHLPRSQYERRYDAVGPGVVNVFGHDLVLANLTIENRQPDHEHAFALYGQPHRFILDNCTVTSNGGDTVSLWNTSFGMYYHRNCKFRGGVDFVCPRGWCYVRDSEFECPTRSAAIWHDGHMNDSMKFVLRNCRFDGVEQFWLGRNHYPSQFYLLDCHFGAAMADKPIERVKDLLDGVDTAPYERKYFYNCHREGGDFAWHMDNLERNPNAPKPNDITAAWTFDGRWDPESTVAPTVRSVETDGQRVHVYFSEDVVGADQTRVVRVDGTLAKYVLGSGTNRLEFHGGTPQSAPSHLKAFGDDLRGATATLVPRFIPDQTLPASTGRREITMVLVGDSTVAGYGKDSESQGWGYALGRFFDDRVRLVNMARGGRSSKSFRNEGWWDEARKLKADFVLIQFGHNDNPGKGPKRETDPHSEFRENLRRYVSDVREDGGIPVLVSPPVRRNYDQSGAIVRDGGNVPYAKVVLEEAKNANCACIDLHQLSRDLFNRLGEPQSHWMQPQGDRTHFTAAGAQRVAGLVADELRSSVPALAEFVQSEALTLNFRSTNSAMSANTLRPLAKAFGASSDANDPPEESLWPDGLFEEEPIHEKTSDRGTHNRNRWVTQVRRPTIRSFRPQNVPQTQSAVIVCPGGGYTGLAYDKEGLDTARWLNSLGVTAIVLKYRLHEYEHTAPGEDAARAIALIRDRAEKLGISPNQIGIMGYSAGGHVASTAGTKFGKVAINGRQISSRPDFMILVYPVISMEPSIAHPGSLQRLLGDQPAASLMRMYSSEHYVTSKTPPTFLVHAVDDDAVPVEHSLRMMRALRAANVPVELAVYEKGGHGFGLVFDPIPAAQWPMRCGRWLRQQGLLRVKDRDSD